ncbi:hypothetical protein H4R20_002847 [Coemansia guatemalensis]|uniref:Maf-like protein n=1 Tax=Coemansia guatemalensis TaxID=2761395 RepID=A0A9W8HUT1_9FUNG|nr:hypothetical protein H4R20_002847 [Coemansia guatemalensis]
MSANAAKLRIPFLGELGHRFRIVLASGSPRRKELLSRLDISYEVIPSDFPEDLDKSQFATAGDYALENAVQKANAVYQKLKSESSKPLLIIGADTVVLSDSGEILEKPASHDDAIATLKGLSGGSNSIFTGVCLVYDTPGATQPQVAKAIELTEVKFYELDDALIEAYVATGDPMDKSGSYGYQSLGYLFVKEIKGEFYNAAGLPCARIYQMLRDLHHQTLV